MSTFPSATDLRKHVREPPQGSSPKASRGRNREVWNRRPLDSGFVDGDVLHAEEAYLSKRFKNQHYYHVKASEAPKTYSRVVIITPGDVIVGDNTGVVVIERNAVEEVTAAAEAIAETEQEVDPLIGEGQSLQQAFEDAEL